MAFAVKIHPKALHLFSNIDSETKSRLKAALKTLSSDPFQKRSGADIKKLKGTKGRQDLYRIRTGDYRIIYAVESRTVFVTSIMHRSKGYDWLD